MGAEISKILVVEDNTGDILWVEKALASETRRHWDIRIARDLKSALSHLSAEEIDLVLLDLGLPDSSGLQTLESLRQYASDVPLVVCSGVDDQDIAFQAVEKGAQDYILKDEREFPSFLKILNYAVLRQRHQRIELELSSTCRLDLISQSIEFIEPSNNAVQRYALTPFEFRLLCLFAGNRNKILSRSEILKHLKGNGTQNLTERTVDVHISTLKHRFPSLKTSIRSVYGEGYVFSSSETAD